MRALAYGGLVSLVPQGAYAVPAFSYLGHEGVAQALAFAIQHDYQKKGLPPLPVAVLLPLCREAVRSIPTETALFNYTPSHYFVFTGD